MLCDEVAWVLRGTCVDYEEVNWIEVFKNGIEWICVNQRYATLMLGNTIYLATMLGNAIVFMALEEYGSSPDTGSSGWFPGPQPSSTSCTGCCCSGEEEKTGPKVCPEAFLGAQLAD